MPYWTISIYPNDVGYYFVVQYQIRFNSTDLETVTLKNIEPIKVFQC